MCVKLRKNAKTNFALGKGTDHHMYTKMISVISLVGVGFSFEALSHQGAEIMRFKVLRESRKVAIRLYTSRSDLEHFSLSDLVRRYQVYI